MDYLRSARAALEKLYTAVCSIYEYEDVQDAETGIVHKEETAVITNQPCRLSFESLSPTSGTDTAGAASQSLKLFLAPEITVKAGSKVVAICEGRTGEYSSSGVPAVYPTHQEVMLELFRGWT